jgi:nucleoside-diphosphate-sugar epimerase
MKILLTGGSGDLGTVLAPHLTQRGDTPIVFDIRPPQMQTAVYHSGSILNRDQLTAAMNGVDMVVHIAAWHGIHEVRREKDVYDFWDLNVTGTMYVLETAVRAKVQHIVHISSSSVDEWPGIYGSSKLMAEELVRTYAARHGLNAIILRPRAFIPYWNKATYANYIEWAKWFWKGAVHIDDVVQATLQSIDLLVNETLAPPPALLIDGAYDFSAADLADWDADGPGSTFARVYPECTELVARYELDPAVKPRPLDISETRRLLGYQPQYSLRHLLQEVNQYGLDGPPVNLG